MPNRDGGRGEKLTVTLIYYGRYMRGSLAADLQ
jgi:hypothetical protein